MNTFFNELNKTAEITHTENGGVSRSTSRSKVLDMFAMGAAYRNRSDEDVIFMFEQALNEDADLAMKCLFYIRDILSGQGERRFFRVAYKWLCDAYPAMAITNIKLIPEYGRWDDLVYITEGTSCEQVAFAFITHQLALDVESKTPSLLGKWMPSQNASNSETKRLGIKLAKYIGLSSREYRKVLSNLRKRINIVERLMSEDRWDEIEFDKIPSKAGLIYRNAFARNEITAKKYESFIKNKKTKVNADALYPHDIARKALDWNMIRKPYTDVDRIALQKYWNNLKDFYNGKQENAIAVIDVSGSMTGVPMEAAISLGAYIAEKSTGPFANHFITFSARPKFVKFEGIDIVDKFHKCKGAEWGMNTNLQAVFDLLFNIAKREHVNPEDIPKRLYIFSDMEFDKCVFFKPEKDNSSRSGLYGWGYRNDTVNSIEEVNSDLEKIERKWDQYGIPFPQVVFWNLNARHNLIPAIGEGFSYVSGFSPVMIDTILGGKTGYDLMIEKLVKSGRYDKIKAEGSI